MSHGSQDKGGFRPIGSVEHERRTAVFDLLKSYNDLLAMLEEDGYDPDMITAPIGNPHLQVARLFGLQEF